MIPGVKRPLNKKSSTQRNATEYFAIVMVLVMYYLFGKDEDPYRGVFAVAS